MNNLDVPGLWDAHRLSFLTPVSGDGHEHRMFVASYVLKDTGYLVFADIQSGDANGEWTLSLNYRTSVSIDEMPTSDRRRTGALTRLGKFLDAGVLSISKSGSIRTGPEKIMIMKS